MHKWMVSIQVETSPIAPSQNEGVVITMIDSETMTFRKNCLEIEQAEVLAMWILEAVKELRGE